MKLAASALAIALGAMAPYSRDQVKPIDGQELARLVAAQRGKVVLLNFWATWCAPCVVEFPDVVAVERAYRERGLVVISVSADAPQEIDSTVIPFLTEHAPDFPVYLLQTNDIEGFLKTVDPDWEGSIPATFFYDREGARKEKRLGITTRKDLERVAEVLVGPKNR